MKTMGKAVGGIGNFARMFVAALLPSVFVTELGVFSAALQRAISANFSSPDNYHITLAFLGDTELARVPAISHMIENAAKGVPPVAISLARPGLFGKPQNAVLWCGLAGAQPLEQMSARLRAALEYAGVPFDNKPMKPHITIARRANLGNVRLADFAPAPVNAAIEKIALMRSERIDNVLTYSPIFTVTLK